MKLILSALISILLFTSSLQAQVEMKMGRIINSGYKKFDRFIGEKDGHIYVLRIQTYGDGTQYYVEKYEADSWKKVWSKNLDLEKIEHVRLNPRFAKVHTIFNGEFIHLAFHRWNKEDGTIRMLARTINTDGVIESGYKDLASLPQSFDFKQSNDGSHILLHTRNKAKNSVSNNNVFIYDAKDFSLKWKKTLPQKEGGKEIEPYDYAISNNGEIAYSYVYVKNKALDKIGTTIAFTKNSGEETLHVSVELTGSKELFIPMENTHLPRALSGYNVKYVVDKYKPNLKFEGDNKIVSIGMFRDNGNQAKKAEKIRNAGIHFISVDVEKKEVISSSEKYFPSEIVDQLSYKSPERQKVFGGNDPGDKYYADSKVFKTDDAYYYITEHGYKESSDNTTVTEYRKEIIASKIDNNSGEVEWIKLLQRAAIDKSLFYDVLVNKGNLYLFVLEHPSAEKAYVKGKEIKPGSFPEVKGIRGCNVRMYKLSPEGNVEKEILYNNKDYSYFPKENDITIKENNDLLFYMEFDGKEKFGTFTVK